MWYVNITSTTTQQLIKEKFMTTVTYQGHTEVNKPAQFITTVKKYGMDMVTGWFDAAEGFNTDHLIIGESYEANINNNEVTL